MSSFQKCTNLLTLQSKYRHPLASSSPQMPWCQGHSFMASFWRKFPRLSVHRRSSGLWGKCPSSRRIILPSLEPSISLCIVIAVIFMIITLDSSSIYSFAYLFIPDVRVSACHYETSPIRVKIASCLAGGEHQRAARKIKRVWVDHLPSTKGWTREL